MPSRMAYLLRIPHEAVLREAASIALCSAESGQAARQASLDG
jgi:hypothetical protein